jgi:hypothetical protein
VRFVLRLLQAVGHLRVDGDPIGVAADDARPPAPLCSSMVVIDAVVAASISTCVRVRANAVRPTTVGTLP